jgi:hypothetical protein
MSAFFFSFFFLSYLPFHAVLGQAELEDRGGGHFDLFFFLDEKKSRFIYLFLS